MKIGMIPTAAVAMKAPQRIPIDVENPVIATGSVRTWSAVKIAANRNSFQAKMAENMAAAMMPGLANGSAIFRKTSKRR